MRMRTVKGWPTIIICVAADQYSILGGEVLLDEHTTVYIVINIESKFKCFIQLDRYLMARINIFITED